MVTLVRLKSENGYSRLVNVSLVEQIGGDFHGEQYKSAVKVTGVDGYLYSDLPPDTLADEILRGQRMARIKVKLK